MPHVYDQGASEWVWMEYDDYLNTDWWKAIRLERIRLDDMKCHDCGSSMNLNVHHVSYERLGREDMADLVTLCKACHKRRHLAEEAAEERRKAAASLASGGGYAARRDVYTLGFVGFAMGEAAKRGLNPRKWDDLKEMRRDYCELLGIDEEDVRIADVQNFSSMQVRESINDLVQRGKTARQISEQLGIGESLVYKQFKRIRKAGEAMKKLDLSNVEAMEPGGRDRIEAGGYVVKVIDVVDNEDKEFLWLVFDIAEGEKRGFYTSAENRDYYADKPNKHGILMSYKDTMSDNAKRMLKGKLKLFTESNPGFDADTAFTEAHPELFKGKLIGLAANMEEYVYEGREDGKWHKGESIDWFHARMKKVDDIRNGNYKLPDRIELDEDDKAKLALQESGATVAEVYDDIPFE